MTDTKIAKTPGRPRQFDRAQALEKAQAVFHSQGYDAVSVGDLTKVLGINPPSLYAAFGNKLGLFGDVLERYSREDGVPFQAILLAGRPVGEALKALMLEGARRYAQHDGVAGCLVIHSTHAAEDEARAKARALEAQAVQVIHDFIAATRPELADVLTDYVSTVMAGLSARARTGHGLDQLLRSADVAGAAVDAILAR